MVSCNLRRAGGIEGLDVDEDIGVRLVIVAEYNVRGVRDWVILHPLVHGSLAPVAAPFGRNTRGAEDDIEEGDKGLDSGVMGSGMKTLFINPISRSAGNLTLLQFELPECLSAS